MVVSMASSKDVQVRRPTIDIDPLIDDQSHRLLELDPFSVICLRISYKFLSKFWMNIGL